MAEAEARGSTETKAPPLSARVEFPKSLREHRPGMLIALDQRGDVINPARFGPRLTLLGLVAGVAFG